jgi:uncharacterized protein (DUF433 family)
MSKEVAVNPSEFRPYKGYRWIVADPRLLGGGLAVRGTRLSVPLILECMANGMTLEDIEESFDGTFPREALPEVLKVAAELASAVHVAA